MRVLMLAVFVSTLALPSLAFAERVGEATRVQRFAYQTPPQAGRAPLYRLGPVLRNARLDTVPAGALEVTFTDGSRLTLGAASSVVVDNYVYAGGRGNQTLRVARGALRYVSGKMPKDQVKVQTPSVTIGIRGTILKLKMKSDKGDGTVFFEQGTGSIDNGKGQVVEMGEGFMATIDEAGNISPPEAKPWSAGEEAVDFGMPPSGKSQHGPDGGSGGGDGAGSPGGGSSND